MVARREITLEAGWNKNPVSAGQPGPSTNIYTYINLKKMHYNYNYNYNRPHHVSHNNISPSPTVLANFEDSCLNYEMK